MKQPHVYLIPGLLCDETVWGAISDPLSTRYCVDIPDLRNFESLEEMGCSIVKNAPAEFHLIGHSMGARVAFEVMLQAQSRVLSLALLDTGVHPASEAEPAKRQHLLDLAASSGMQAVADAWIPGMIHPDRIDDRELVSRIEKMVTGYNARQFNGQVQALLNRRDLQPLLGEIHCPTLVACGRQDAWANLQQHEFIASRIDGAELAIIENSGHMVPMEQPEATLRLLSDWLARQPQA